MPTMRLTLRLVSWTALWAGLAGCAVGPDYRGAPPVAQAALAAPAYVRAPAAAGIAPKPAPSDWWQGLGDPRLTALIEAALAHNPDMHAAQARLRQARAQFSQQQAAFTPSLTADAAAPRLRSPNLSSFTGQQQSGGQGPLQLYSTTFDASWELDLFGGTRRGVQAASAQAQAAMADLADVQVSLAAEVAQAYIGLRDQQWRLRLAEQSAALQQQMLDLTRRRRLAGTAADIDVERLSSQVEGTRANLVPLSEQIAESLDRLAVLTGKAPGDLDAQLSAAGGLPVVPASVLVGDPAALLRQRPDIRAAERRLAASYAQIGVKEAAMFPKVTLMGALGFTSTSTGNLFTKSAFTWMGIPFLQWNFLSFGRNREAVVQAEAARDEAEANYRKAVLSALQDANDALSRYGHQREHLLRLQRVQESATRAAQLMRQRYAAGASSLIDLLDAQRAEYAAQQDAVSGQAALLDDFVSLQKSLGLGWRSQEPSASAPSTGTGAPGR
jgi:NodT family efflux transporter outer membrane factor (OMF) lipoprotein